MKNATLFRRFLEDDSGAVLVEYTVLVAFVMVTIVGLAHGFHNSVAGVTGVTNSNLASASTVVH